MIFKKIYDDSRTSPLETIVENAGGANEMAAHAIRNTDGLKLDYIVGATIWCL